MLRADSSKSLSEASVTSTVSKCLWLRFTGKKYRGEKKWNRAQLCSREFFFSNPSVPQCEVIEVICQHTFPLSVPPSLAHSERSVDEPRVSFSSSEALRLRPTEDVLKSGPDSDETPPPRSRSCREKHTEVRVLTEATAPCVCECVLMWKSSNRQRHHLMSNTLNVHKCLEKISSPGGAARRTSGKESQCWRKSH